MKISIIPKNITKDNGELYKIGCIGKINSYEETDDGRYLINLVGKNYFIILNEQISMHAFRTVKAQIYRPDAIITNNYKIKEHVKIDLIKKYSNFVNTPTQEIDINILKKIDSSTLIKFIGISSPFTVAEKQMLLETYDLNELATKLITLFDYYKVYQENKETIN